MNSHPFENPLFCISIVSHGQTELVYDLVNDISNSDGFKYFQIVLTLNTPSEFFDLTKFPKLNITILQNLSPKGFGANHNQAFLLCKAKFFIVANPDIRIDKLALSLLYDYCLKAGDFGAVTPNVLSKLNIPEDYIRENLSPYSLFKRYVFREKNACINVSKFYWACGMFLIFKPIIFREVQGFNEDYFLYCEDYDICGRLFLSGYKIEIAQEISVTHSGQRSSHKSFKYLLMHLTSLYKVWTSTIFYRIALFNLNRNN